MKIINAQLAYQIDRAVMMRTRYNWLIVPVMTPVYTTLHFFVMLYFPQVGLSLIGPFLFFIFTCIMFGGLLDSLVGALILSLYAYRETDYDPWRLAWVVIFSVIGAVMAVVVRRLLIQWHGEAEANRRKAELVDSLNGNIEILKEINRELVNLAKAIAVMEKSAIEDNINLIQDKAANLAQRAVGWHQLALETKYVKDQSPLDTQELKPDGD